jgi:hypothetical protein
MSIVSGKLCRSSFLLVLLLENNAGTTDLTGSSGSDETRLLTGWAGSGHGRWVTNVLLVTTTVWMVDWVHGDTSNSWPSVSLGLVLPVGATGLEEWLIGSLATSNDTNHSSALTLDGLSNTGWELQSGLVTIIGVTDDDSGGTRGSGEGATVTVLGLAVGDNGTLWHGVDWQDVANGESSFLSSVDIHSCVHSFNSNEIFSALLVFVLVSEHHLSKRGTSAGVVDDVSDDTSHVTLSLSVVEGSEASWGNSSAGVSLEDG